MNFNPVEIIALVFALAGLVKIVLILTSKNSWQGFVKEIYKRPLMLMVGELILACIVLYYLLQYISIIQVIGGVVLGALLTGMVFASYSKELMPTMLKLLKANAWKKAWLPILVWFILILWTIGALFGFT